MAFFDFLRTKASALAAAITLQFATGQAVWTPDNFEKLAREGYRLNPIVFGCVDRLARGAAGVPLVLYRTSTSDRGFKSAERKRAAVQRQLDRATGRRAKARLIKRLVKNNDLEEVEAHPLLDLLNRPNDLYGGARLIEALVAYRCLQGNAYMEAVGPDDGPPRELYVHRPDRIQVVVGTAAEPVSHYEYRVGGVTRRLPAADVFHWKTFNPLDDWYGQAPLIAAARSTDANNAARAWNVALTQNSARPSGLLKVKGTTVGNKNALKAWIDEFKKNWMGAANAGRPAIIAPPDGTEIDWVQTAFTAVEMSWLDGLNLSAREICVVFNVPSILLGDAAAAKYANYEQARRALYQEGIFPLLDLLVSDLNAWLTPKFGKDLFLGYDADAVDAVQEDQEAAHKRSREDFKEGLITRNEARAAIGYDEVPDGDKFVHELMPPPAALPPGGAPREKPPAKPGAPPEEDEDEDEVEDARAAA